MFAHYNGLTLAACLAVSLFVTVVYLAYVNNGFKRRHLVMRGSHIVSRHYTSRQAHRAFYKLTAETNTQGHGHYDVIPLDRLDWYRELCWA